MKIEDNRHFFSPHTSKRQANDSRFQELMQTVSAQFEEETKLDHTIDLTVNSAFHNRNLT